jgi:hypothetical protein
MSRSVYDLRCWISFTGPRHNRKADELTFGFEDILNHERFGGFPWNSNAASPFCTVSGYASWWQATCFAMFDKLPESSWSPTTSRDDPGHKPLIGCGPVPLWLMPLGLDAIFARILAAANTD